jgi:glycosyltransferase involved in cell wall biosynthesis
VANAEEIQDNQEEREPISAFVISYNEEDQIAQCLESLRFCDEIIVVDSFSTDRTAEISRELGVRVIQRKWSGYRDQKEFGLQATSYEWVINLDADERVSPELRNSILQVLRQEHQRKQNNFAQCAEAFDAYDVNRVVYHLGRWWRVGWYPEYRTRFIRKSKVTWGGVDPHEKVIVSGRTSRLEGELHHFSYDDLAEQLHKLNSFSSIRAREEYKLGKRASVFKMFWNPSVRIFKFYFLKKGYKEGLAGAIVAVVEGFYTFMKYAKLWECEYSENAEKRDRAKDGNR